MKRFLKSPANRAFVLMLVGTVLWGLWLRPDLKRAVAAARADDSPVWAVVLLIWGLVLMAWTIFEMDAEEELDNEYWRRRALTPDDC